VQITLNDNQYWRARLFGGAIAALASGFVAIPGTAFAESAFVNQVGPGGSFNAPTFGFPGGGPGGGGNLPPEFTSPKSGPDLANTLVVGNYNKSLQLQAGARDHSQIGILGGKQDSVNVLQAGSNLQSNIWLLNATGTHVNVVQPQGAAPINMIIAHLPNGSWFIKR
jgi:hypothetical protein